jgi:hypothetical protein
MRLPRAAAELDSEVTVAASGYSPPTPMPRQNLQCCRGVQDDISIGCEREQTQENATVHRCSLVCG